ncbi:trypsin-like peptidase domain-containing protein [Seohaeicola saemankumensis]|uniref:serine protease n=1 Tax=Seohaeicola saemankumensis TaxID=481181 RepID=UPI001E635937|nr:serine protease [Seohaeicola saemankumensis]MCD1625836.1 trypsin-like peptidase domain-containing protein [Seohaeicola saemankumensis]
MFRFIIAIIGVAFCLTRPLMAQQEVVWIQIEAHSTLAEAQERARAYAAELPDVNGFALNSGWYAIALGPYVRSDADQVLRVYRAERTIPNDSYIAFTSSFRQQFWPIGANLLNLPQPAQPTAPEPEQPLALAPVPLTDEDGIPQPPLPDESPNEARTSEALLTRDARENLQVALKWAGFYDGAIDGAFGRGTRSSMAAWQSANNFDTTGILTTLQRETLLKQYNAVLEGLDLQMVRDDTAGIEILLPLGVVSFDRIEPPFVHYETSNDIDARVLLISQEGDQATMFGLYDIMQTLQIVPTEGPRERREDGFTLIGQGGDFVSHTEVSLLNGRIKGFTLVWPAGDEDRRLRLLGEMQKSFARTDGVLDFAAGMPGEQRIDLVSGLEIRKPRMTRSGFFVDTQGTVVTTADAVAACTRITLDNDAEAQVLESDPAQGIAVLRPDQPLVPMAAAAFQTATPRLQSEISVAGFSYGGILSAPTLTYGRLADLRGLNGEENLKRLELDVLPGDIGGPVFDASGAVLGMLTAPQDNGRQLPQDVSFSVDAAAIRAMLDRLGLTPTEATETAMIHPVDLTRRAGAMTVLVSCWE